MDQAPDPVLATLDLAQAGAILANMIEAWFAGAPPSAEPEGFADDDAEDCRPPPEPPGLHLPASVDPRPGALQPGKYRAPIPAGHQSEWVGLEPRPHPGPRPRSRPVGQGHHQPRRLQNPGERCRHGYGRCRVRHRSVALGALQPAMAPAARTVRHHSNSRDRRGWYLRSHFLIPLLGRGMLGLNRSRSQIRGIRSTAGAFR